MPNPQDLLQALGTRRDERWILEDFERRLESYTDWRNDWRRYDDFLRGEWFVEFPDGKTVKDKPRIENRIRTTVEDHAKQASEVFPTIRVEAATDTEAARSRAASREQLIQYYHQLSSTKVKMPLLFADQIGVGLACIKVWPDFNVPKDKRFPIFSRVDPRAVLPPPNWEVGTEPHDIIVHRYQKLRYLKREYPEAASVLVDQFLSRNKNKRQKLTDTSEVLIVEFYNDEEITFAAFAGQDKAAGTILFSEPNRTGRNPIVLIPRPTADGRIRGQFGDTLPALANENRLFSYIGEYIDQAVYAPVIAKGIPGRDLEIGPGAVNYIPDDAEVGRMAPATLDPNVWRYMSDAERHQRRGSGQPEARSGDVSASIISGAAVDALQGPLITNIHALQQQMEWGLEKANEIAQAQDVAYADVRKTIVGYDQGGLFRLTYKPSDLIKPGDASNVVTYGAGASVGQFNRIIMLLRLQQAGYASKRWAAVESGVIDNWLREQNTIIDETAMDALLAGVYQQAAQGNLEPLARLQQARDDKVDPLSALADIVAASAPAGPAPGEAAGPPGLPGEATPGQQEAAAQTGAPGGGTSLPPLSALLAG